MDKEILEGNQEMALFCDAIEYKLDGEIYYDFGYSDFVKGSSRAIAAEKLSFHEDWNFLQAVVEKIELIYDEFHGHFAVYTGGNSCTIQGTKLRTDPNNKRYAYYDEVVVENKKRSVWLCALHFIRWYKIHINGEPVSDEWTPVSERLPRTAGFYQIQTEYNRILDIPYVRVATGEMLWAAVHSTTITSWRRQEHNKKQDEQGYAGN